jgi:hypothetical protein
MIFLFLQEGRTLQLIDTDSYYDLEEYTPLIL